MVVSRCGWFAGATGWVWVGVGFSEWLLVVVGHW